MAKMMVGKKRLEIADAYTFDTELNTHMGLMTPRDVKVNDIFRCELYQVLGCELY